jgi:hypothetical protein
MLKLSLVSAAALSLVVVGGCRESTSSEPESEQPASGGAPAPVRPESPAAEVESDSLVGYLKGLPTARAVRGDIPAQKGLIETEKFIASELKKMGYEPRLQDLVWNLKYQDETEAKLKEQGRPVYGGPKHPETTPDLAGNTWHNIIVEIKGTKNPEEMILVGAHFDAVAGSPGADDNGSGAAALLEIARVLKGRPMERTVRLVFFNLEEIGLRGAQEYAKSLREKLNSGEEKLIGMMSLEMLGYYTDEPNSQRSPIPKIEGVFEPPTVGDFIGILTLKAYSPFARELAAAMKAAAPEMKVEVADFAPVPPPDFMRSDHAPFWLIGQPAVLVTDTSEFRNPNYHKPTDTIETLDQERYTLVTRALAGAIHSMARPAEE